MHNSIVSHNFWALVILRKKVARELKVKVILKVHIKFQFSRHINFEVTICPAAGQLFGKIKCPAVFLRMSFSGSGYISSLSSINLVLND